jgi:hypothetical protein
MAVLTANASGRAFFYDALAVFAAWRRIESYATP